MRYASSLQRICRRVSRVAIGFSVLCILTTASASQPAPAFSDDDVSWLFPAPHTASDLTKLIAIKDVGGEKPVWSQYAFESFASITESRVSHVPQTNSGIGLPADALAIDAWYIAGIRIDPGAPGLSPEIAEQFGRVPEIRLIVQPVTVSRGTVTIHDDAVHLVFDFVKPGFNPPAQQGCAQQLNPDLDSFKSVESDLAAFKAKLAAGGFGGVKIATAGLPLGVHPGLANPATRAAVAQEMKAFLARHLPLARLDAMAVVGVPANAPSPWMFFAIALTKDGYVPVPNTTLDGAAIAMAFVPEPSANRVVPMPATNNGAAITCKNAMLGPGALPIAARQGVSTAQLFAADDPDPGTVQSVTASIADPNRSHIFNTDCVSCHTESGLATGLENSPGVDPAVLPLNSWVVRNFGWAPTTEHGQPTATRRTEAETRAIVDFLNAPAP